MLKGIFSYIKTRPWIYLIITIMLLIDYAIVVVPTQIVQTIIDAMMDNTLTQSELIFQLGYLASVTVIAYIAIAVWSGLLYRESARYRYLLRNQLFQKMINMRLPFYEKFRSGDMMTRFTNDVESVVTMAGFGMMSALIAIATLLFLIPVMLMTNVVVSLVGIFPLVIVSILFLKMGNRQEVYIDELRDSVSDLSNEVLEVVDGIRVTRAYGNSQLGRQRFQSKTSDLRQKADKIMAIEVMYGRVVNIGLAISSAAIILLGGYLLKNGQISLSQIIALQLYSTLLLEPAFIVADLILVYKSAKVSHRKVTQVLEETDDLEADGEQSIANIDTIVFDNYTFKYPNAKVNALTQLSVALQRGQTLGVVGKTGSGKTTFIRQFLRQYPIGSGEFLINNVSAVSYQRRHIENLIAYVPQENTLFSTTIKDNILVGKMDADIIEIAAAVQSASFSSDLEKLPDGIDTLVGEKGVSISGGQKQRVSLSRAFIKESELLLLDDALSAVDAKTERSIIESLQTMRQDKTTIIVSHRLSAVMHANKIIVLKDGRIAEMGTPQELLANKQWFYEQYEKQKLEEGESNNGFDKTID